MNEQNPFVEDRPILPRGLNILTILTFIGSAYQLVSIPLSKFGIGMAKKALENPDALESMSEKEVADLEKSVRLMDTMEANAIPLWIITLVAVALCVYGAIQMRRLKKEGFTLYTIGELLPLIATPIIIGFSNLFPNALSYVFGIGIPLLFIALYATQRKYLK